MEKRILLAFILCLPAFLGFSQTADKEGNEKLKLRMQRQSERAKSLFYQKPQKEVAKGQFKQTDVMSEQERIRRAEAEIAEINRKMAELDKKDPAKKKSDHHAEEMDRISMLEEEKRKQKELESSLYFKVAGFIDHRNDAQIALVCDSLLDLKSLDDRAKVVAGLIIEYADSYKNVPYEDLSPDKTVIRHFVTFVNDPSHHPSGSYYCKVWDNNYIYCYPGEKFDLNEPKDLTLVDFSHRYHPPLDQYTGPNSPVSRGYYDKGKWNGKTLVTDKDYIHGGVDLRFNPGETPNIYAVFDGVVRIAGLNGSLTSGFGNLIVIRHPNGLETSYAHLSQINVKVGDHVKAGDIIGIGGGTGQGTAPHLDFKMGIRGRYFDPESVINFANNPKYDNGGAELGQLFASRIRVWMSKDSKKRHNYKQHEVQVLHLLKKKSLRESFIVYNPSYTGHDGTAMLPAKP
jgi:murein DD-endopeptidase MepM/ murein hydrolase activator NlpD